MMHTKGPRRPIDRRLMTLSKAAANESNPGDGRQPSLSGLAPTARHEYQPHLPARSRLRARALTSTSSLLSTVNRSIADLQAAERAFQRVIDRHSHAASFLSTCLGFFDALKSFEYFTDWAPFMDKIQNLATESAGSRNVRKLLDLAHKVLLPIVAVRCRADLAVRSARVALHAFIQAKPSRTAFQEEIRRQIGIVGRQLSRAERL